MADNKKNQVNTNVNKLNSQWLKNTLRSLGVAGNDALKEVMPATGETISNVSSMVTSAITKQKSEKSYLKRFQDAVTSNEAFKFGKEFFGNAVEDIKSGNIYNTEREPDFGFSDDDFSFGDIEEDSFDFSFADEINQQSVMNTAATVKTIQQNTEFQVKAAKATVDTMATLSTTHLMKINELGNQIVGELSNINTNLAGILEYNNTNMTKFIEASIGYYEQMTTPKEEERVKEKIEPENLIDSSGGLNIQKYKEYVLNNIKSMSGEGMMGMLSMVLENKDMATSNPLGMVLTAGMKKLIPEYTKRVMAEFDKSFEDFIPTMLERIGEWADTEEEGTVGVLKKYIGKAFGTREKRKKGFDFSKIEKGPVPYNGMANHTIVEIIPKYLRESNTYLREIAEAVTGKSNDQMSKGFTGFDWETGQFKSIDQLQANFNDSLQSIVTSAMSFSEFGDKLSESRKFLTNDKDLEKYDDALEQLYTRIEQQKGQIDYSNKEVVHNLVEGIYSSDSIKNLIESTIEHLQETSSEAIGSAHVAKMKATREKNRAIDNINMESGKNGIHQIADRGKYDDYIDRKYKREADASLNENGHSTKNVNVSVISLLEGIQRTLDRGIFVEIKKGLNIPHSVVESTNSDNNENKQNNTQHQIENNTKEYFKAMLETEHIEEERDAEIDNDETHAPIRTAQEMVSSTTKIMNAIMARNSDQAWDAFISGTVDKMKAAGRWVSDNFLSPIKDALFGKKDEDGYLKGGMFEGINNRLKESVFQFRHMMTGKGYTKADGTFVDDANEEEMKNTVVGKMKNIANIIKDSISVKLFGKKDDDGEVELDENGKPVKGGLMGSFSGGIKKAAYSLTQGLYNWKVALFGEDEEGSEEEKVEKFSENLKEKFIDFLPTAITGTMLGGGIGAIAGLSTAGTLMETVALGPIGAIAGLTIGIATKSDKFKNWLFGEKDDDGDRVGGIISKNMQEYFKKNGLYLAGGATLGLLKGIFMPGAGWLTGIVGGPIAGAVTGIASTMIARSDMFQKFLFGDEKSGYKGLVNTVKSLFSKFGDVTGTSAGGKLAGMATISGLAGAALGHITVNTLITEGILGASLSVAGPIGGALFGLGAAIIAQKDNFKTWFFGETDPETGEKREGLLGKFKNMLSVHVFEPVKNSMTAFGRDAKTFLYYDVLQKFNLVLQGITEPVGKVFHSIIGGISSSFKSFGGYLRDSFADKIVETTQSIIEPIKNVIGLGAKAIWNASKIVVAAPLKLASAITSPIITTVSSAIGGILKGSLALITKPIQFAMKPLVGAIHIATDVISAPFKLIANVTGKVNDYLHKKLDQLAIFTNTMKNTMIDFGKRLILDNPITNLLRKGKDKLLEFGDRITNTVKIIFSPLTEFVKGAVTAVKNSIIGGLKKFGGFLLKPFKALFGLGKKKKDPAEMGFIRRAWYLAGQGYTKDRSGEEMSLRQARKNNNFNKKHARKFDYYEDEKDGSYYIQDKENKNVYFKRDKYGKDLGAFNKKEIDLKYTEWRDPNTGDTYRLSSDGKKFERFSDGVFSGTVSLKDMEDISRGKKVDITGKKYYKLNSDGETYSEYDSETNELLNAKVKIKKRDLNRMTGESAFEKRSLLKKKTTGVDGKAANREKNLEDKHRLENMKLIEKYTKHQRKDDTQENRELAIRMAEAQGKKITFHDIETVDAKSKRDEFIRQQNMANDTADIKENTATTSETLIGIANDIRVALFGSDGDKAKARELYTDHLTKWLTRNTAKDQQESYEHLDITGANFAEALTHGNKKDKKQAKEEAKSELRERMDNINADPNSSLGNKISKMWDAQKRQKESGLIKINEVYDEDGNYSHNRYTEKYQKKYLKSTGQWEGSVLQQTQLERKEKAKEKKKEAKEKKKAPKLKLKEIKAEIKELERKGFDRDSYGDQRLEELKEEYKKLKYGDDYRSRREFHLYDDDDDNEDDIEATLYEGTKLEAELLMVALNEKTGKEEKIYRLYNPTTGERYNKQFWESEIKNDPDIKIVNDNPIAGYAKGTKHAKRGTSLIGEKGAEILYPNGLTQGKIVGIHGTEIVNMNGGEEVVPNSNIPEGTKDIADGYSKQTDQGLLDNKNTTNLSVSERILQQLLKFSAYAEKISDFDGIDDTDDNSTTNINKLKSKINNGLIGVLNVITGGVFGKIFNFYKAVRENVEIVIGAVKEVYKKFKDFKDRTVNKVKNIGKKTIGVLGKGAGVVAKLFSKRSNKSNYDIEEDGNEQEENTNATIDNEIDYTDEQSQAEDAKEQEDVTKLTSEKAKEEASVNMLTSEDVEEIKQDIDKETDATIDNEIDYTDEQSQAEDAKEQEDVTKLTSEKAKEEASIKKEDDEDDATQEGILAELKGLNRGQNEENEKQEEENSFWSSLFSKKGLLTAGLLALAPSILKLVDWISGPILSTLTAIGDFLEGGFNWLMTNLPKDLAFGLENIGNGDTPEDQVRELGNRGEDAAESFAEGNIFEGIRSLIFDEEGNADSTSYAYAKGITKFSTQMISKLYGFVRNPLNLLHPFDHKSTKSGANYLIDDGKNLLSKMKKLFGFGGNMSEKAAREAAENAARKAAQKAAQKAVKELGEEATEEVIEKVTREAAENAIKKTLGKNAKNLSSDVIQKITSESTDKVVGEIFTELATGKPNTATVADDLLANQGDNAAATIANNADDLIANQGDNAAATIANNADDFIVGQNIDKAMGQADDLFNQMTNSPYDLKTNNVDDLLKKFNNATPTVGKEAAEEVTQNKTIWTKLKDLTVGFFDNIKKSFGASYGDDGIEAGAKASGKIARAFAKVSAGSKHVIKAISKITAILGTTVALAATVIGYLAKEVVWVVFGVIDGLTSAKKLFGVSDPDALMITLSGILGGALGTNIGSIVDIVLTTLGFITGTDFKGELLWAIYAGIKTALGEEDDIKKYEQMRENTRKKYLNYKDQTMLKEYKTQQAMGAIAPDITFEDYQAGVEEGKYSATYIGYTDYLYNEYSSLSDDIMDGISNMFDKDDTNTYVDIRGNKYKKMDNGAYKVTSFDNKDMGFISADVLLQDNFQIVKKITKDGKEIHGTMIDDNGRVKFQKSDTPITPTLSQEDIDIWTSYQSESTALQESSDEVYVDSYGSYTLDENGNKVYIEKDTDASIAKKYEESTATIFLDSNNVQRSVTRTQDGRYYYLDNNGHQVFISDTNTNDASTTREKMFNLTNIEKDLINAAKKDGYILSDTSYYDYKNDMNHLSFYDTNNGVSYSPDKLVAIGRDAKNSHINTEFLAKYDGMDIPYKQFFTSTNSEKERIAQAIVTTEMTNAPSPFYNPDAYDEYKDKAYITDEDKARINAEKWLVDEKDLNLKEQLDGVKYYGLNNFNTDKKIFKDVHHKNDKGGYNYYYYDKNGQPVKYYESTLYEEQHAKTFIDKSYSVFRPLKRYVDYGYLYALLENGRDIVWDDEISNYIDLQYINENPLGSIYDDEYMIKYADNYICANANDFYKELYGNDGYKGSDIGWCYNDTITLIGAFSLVLDEKGLSEYVGQTYFYCGELLLETVFDKVNKDDIYSNRTYGAYKNTFFNNYKGVLKKAHKSGMGSKNTNSINSAWDVTVAEEKKKQEKAANAKKSSTPVVNSAHDATLLQKQKQEEKAVEYSKNMKTDSNSVNSAHDVKMMEEEKARKKELEELESFKVNSAQDAEILRKRWAEYRSKYMEEAIEEGDVEEGGLASMVAERKEEMMNTENYKTQFHHPNTGEAWFDVDGSYYVLEGETYTQYSQMGDKIRDHVEISTVELMVKQGLLKIGKYDPTLHELGQTTVDNMQELARQYWNKFKGESEKALSTVKINSPSDLEHYKNKGFLSTTFSYIGAIAEAIKLSSNNVANSGNTTSGGSGTGIVQGGRGEINASHHPSTLNGSTYFSQSDSRWANTEFQRSDGIDDGATISDTGCGPTAMSMVVSDMTNHQTNPVEMSKLAQITGDRDDTGTNWNFIDTAANTYGLNSMRTSFPSSSYISDRLNSGTPMVLSGQNYGNNNSPYTSSGHYVVAVGKDSSGNVIINDPRGAQYSKHVNPNDLAKETNMAWSFSNPNTVQTVLQNGISFRNGLPTKSKKGGRGGVTAQDVVNVAKNEIGTLQDSVENSSGEPNKYSRELFACGGYWCAAFVSWCVWTAANKDKTKAKELMCGSLSTSCNTIMNNFKNKNQFSSTPQIGSFIMFNWADSGDALADHIGIVSGFDNNTVYSIEGNSSNPNGGADGVFEHQYSINDSQIMGYCHPKYDGSSDFNGIFNNAGVDSSMSVFDKLGGYMSTIGSTLFNAVLTGNYDIDWKSALAQNLGSSTGTTNGVASNAVVTGTVIKVPRDVQTGITENYTNYDYWYPKWASSSTQRTIADDWDSKGRAQDKGIAMLDGNYLLAMTPKFGTTGDIVQVKLEDGETFNAILGDSKGADASSEWGHTFGDSGKSDIIEWEACVGSDSAVGRGHDGISLEGNWKGKYVDTVTNGGPYYEWLKNNGGTSTNTNSSTSNSSTGIDRLYKGMESMTGHALFRDAKGFYSYEGTTNGTPTKKYLKYNESTGLSTDKGYSILSNGSTGLFYRDNRGEHSITDSISVMCKQKMDNGKNIWVDKDGTYWIDNNGNKIRPSYGGSGNGPRKSHINYSPETAGTKYMRDTIVPDNSSPTIHNSKYHITKPIKTGGKGGDTSFSVGKRSLTQNGITPSQKIVNQMNANNIGSGNVEGLLMEVISLLGNISSNSSNLSLLEDIRTGIRTTSGGNTFNTTNVMSNTNNNLNNVSKQNQKQRVGISKNEQTARRIALGH